MRLLFTELSDIDVLGKRMGCHTFEPGMGDAATIPKSVYYRKAAGLHPEGIVAKGMGAVSLASFSKKQNYKFEYVCSPF